VPTTAGTLQQLNSSTDKQSYSPDSPTIKQAVADGNPLAREEAVMIHAIPTTFNSTRYRSRLEARWGAFFDLLEWDAHYEPLDLDGYIPDFVLHGKDERILVEVKPVAGMDDPLFKETAAKIEGSGWQHEALIVSYFLPDSKVYGAEFPCIGWLMERYEYCEPFSETGEIKTCWSEAPFHDGGGLGFHSDYGSYRNRITGFYDGDSHVLSQDPRIERCWREAGNLVQWRRSA
jgi:hypothetical protein